MIPGVEIGKLDLLESYLIEELRRRRLRVQSVKTTEFPVLEVWAVRGRGEHASVLSASVDPREALGDPEAAIGRLYRSLESQLLRFPSERDLEAPLV